MKLSCGDRTLDLASPKIMGILNVTPDSFSDGGKFNQIDKALEHTEAMILQGAAIVDVGGESTRPGASPVSVEKELDRVIPVVDAIARRLDVVISVDTSRPEVITQSSQAGAHIINDVRALQLDGAMQAAAETGLPVCMMHMQGEPGSMQDNPQYEDVVSQVGQFLSSRASAARQAGIAEDQILLDPGFGFGKTKQHNYRLLNQLNSLRELGYPLLTGLSRKRMIAEILGDHSDPAERDVASAAAAMICAQNGASIIRVHNVRQTWEALQVVHATLREGNE